MATTTRAVMFDNLARSVGFLWSSTTSGGSTTTAVDDEAQQFDTNSLPGKWLYILAGTQASIVLTARQIASVSGSTITVAPAFAATVTSGDSYMILDYHPQVLRDSLEEAMRNVYPSWSRRGLYKLIRDETVIVDNMLSNSSFETFSGGFTGWTETGSPTVTQVATPGTPHGAYVAKMVAGGGASGVMSQNVILDLSQESYGKTITFSAWAWAVGASQVGIEIKDNIANFIADTSYHSGNVGWERIEVSGVLNTSNLLAVSCRLVCTATQTGYFDLAVAHLGDVERYTLPTSIAGEPSNVEMQASLDHPGGLTGAGAFLSLGRGNRPQPGRILRISGMGRLSVPTTEAGTIELDEHETGAIVALAASYAHRILKSTRPGDRQFHDREQDRWENTAALLLAQHGRKPMPASIRDGWDISESSGVKELILYR